MAARLYKYVGVENLSATDASETSSQNTCSPGCEGAFFWAKCGVNATGSTNFSLRVGPKFEGFIGLSSPPASGRQTVGRSGQTNRLRSEFCRRVRRQRTHGVFQPAP